LHFSIHHNVVQPVRYLTYHDRSWLDASVIPRAYNKLYTTAFVLRLPASRPKTHEGWCDVILESA